MEELKKRFPAGLDYTIVYDPTRFSGSRSTTSQKTLFEASPGRARRAGLSETWRASIIPLLAIPVSLIGTFAAMAAFGFSLNTLSLFGLVLAIGIVVDDAIVVVENIERHIEDGLVRESRTQGDEGISGALVAIALVLCSVFIPTAFIGGITGQFFRQFALTIAVSTRSPRSTPSPFHPRSARFSSSPAGRRRIGFNGSSISCLVGSFGLSISLRMGSKAMAIPLAASRLAVLVLLVYAGFLRSQVSVSKSCPAVFSRHRTAAHCRSPNSRTRPHWVAPRPWSARSEDRAGDTRGPQHR